MAETLNYGVEEIERTYCNHYTLMCNSNSRYLPPQSHGKGLLGTKVKLGIKRIKKNVYFHNFFNF